MQTMSLKIKYQRNEICQEINEIDIATAKFWTQQSTKEIRQNYRALLK